MSSLLVSMGFLFIGGGASILGTGISPRIWFTSLASESIVASRLIFGAWGSGVDVAGPGWGSEVDVPGPGFSVASSVLFHSISFHGVSSTRNNLYTI